MVDISAPTANLSIYIYEPYYHLSSIKSTEKEANQSAKMVLLDHLWDDVVAGPQPERGLKHLKKVFTQPLNVKDIGEGSSKSQRSLSMPASPGTPGTPSPTSAKKDNVWRSVFHPGSNLATKTVGANYFDRPEPNSPTVYDWLYSGDTRSKHR